MIEPRPSSGSLMFLDIETLGFVGRPVFLIGCLFEQPQAEIVQFLARDYAEEASALEAFRAELGRRPSPVWVTFNGASFDLPALRLRFIANRLEAPSVPGHLDLLHTARRLWGPSLPDCRLRTLEARLLGRHRIADLPGERIPAAYHAFVRTGEPWEMLGILKHNVADLLALRDLTRLAAEMRPQDGTLRSALREAEGAPAGVAGGLRDEG